MQIFYKPNQVELLYRCPECDETFSQFATDLCNSGILVCPKCDIDGVLFEIACEEKN